MDRAEASGEFVLPAAAGKTVWLQPRHEAKAGQPLWATAVAYQPPPPVDRKPVMLAIKHEAGSRTLELISRKIFAGRMKGERRSKRKGESVEFADYRNYVVGDDLRFLDWNIYARLEKLLLKLFMEEEDLSVSILFDVSNSI